MKVALLFVLALGFACVPAKHVEADISYGAQINTCVDKATTLAESKACRARTDQEWGLTDGGAK